MTIGEVARATGVPATTLRYYEDAGILPRARRVKGQRRYGPELLDLIRVARFAKTVGFTLAELRLLCGALNGGGRLGQRWRRLARAKVRELDAVIDGAQRMKDAIEYGFRCGCIRIEDCLPKG